VSKISNFSHRLWID